MDFRQTRIAKIMSLLVLFLFIWSFTGVCDIVYAARNGTLLTQNSRKHHKIEHAGEGFQKTLDDIEHILEKTKKKKTRTERKAEKKRLMTKKFEIEEHDRELRERFKETEERIKDLPDEIKKRHRDFIKKYEENLRTLKDRLDAVERAKTDKDEEREIKKAREYLKKARPKKKHIPLDPNKLPHRTPEDKEIKLEEKKSEKRKMPKLRKLTQIYQDDLGPDENHILVASNGSLAGLLESETDLMAQNAILAQTMVPHYPKSTPPTAADLAETIDAQFTDAIKAKAAELNHHPVKIYNWVSSIC